MDDPQQVARAAAEAMRRADRAAEGAGVRLLDVGPGRARVAMTVRADHVNGHGICHGGYLFLLADAALAYASNSHGVSAVAAGADIDFLRPVPLRAELVAEAVELALTPPPAVPNRPVEQGAGPAPRSGPCGSSGARPGLRSSAAAPARYRACRRRNSVPRRGPDNTVVLDHLPAGRDRCRSAVLLSGPWVAEAAAGADARCPCSSSCPSSPPPHLRPFPWPPVTARRSCPGRSPPRC